MEARGLAPLELKLQVVVSLLVWVLGIELRPPLAAEPGLQPLMPFLSMFNVTLVLSRHVCFHPNLQAVTPTGYKL